MNAGFIKKLLERALPFVRFRDHISEEQILNPEDRNEIGITLQQELGDLWDRFKQMILKTACAHTDTRADAEDVVQTIFLKLAKSGIPSELRLNPGGYLHQAAINEARKVYRSRQRQKIDSGVDVLKIGASARSVEYEMSRDLLRAKDALREDAADIVDLHYTHGYTHLEIAEMKGLNEKAVAMSLSRSRERMGQLMGYFEAERKRRRR